MNKPITLDYTKYVSKLFNEHIQVVNDKLLGATTEEDVNHITSKALMVLKSPDKLTIRTQKLAHKWTTFSIRQMRARQKLRELAHNGQIPTDGQSG